MPQLWFAIALYSASLFFPLPDTAFRLHADPIPPVFSFSQPAFSADHILAFAAQLMRQKEYYRAITEYRRFLYSFPRDERRAMAHFRVGLAFYRGTAYGEALEVFGEVAESYPDGPYGKLARLWQGESLMRQGQFEKAESLYGVISQTWDGEITGQYAVYRRTWALLYQHEWSAARERFQSLPVNNSFGQTARHLAEVLPDTANSDPKSPLLAGILSAALPGSGQLYVGRRGDAILAFLLNGLFVVGIVEALNQDQPAVAGMLGLFEAGWYTGNIYGAVNSARKHNMRQARRFIRKMEDRFPYEPPSSSSTAGPMGIRLGLRF